MRRTLLLLATAFLLVLPATAHAYTQSLSAQTTLDGQDHSLTFSNLPQGSGNVTLTIGLEGDFSYGDLSNPEGSVNYADGNNLGTFIPANDTPPSTDCGSTIYQKVFTFPTSYINDNNEVVIRIDLYQEVNTFCSRNYVYATIDYVDNVAPTITSIGAQSTDEDTSDSTSFTVSDNEDADGSLLVAATSNNQAVIADGSISVTNTNGSGTVSWTPVVNASGTAAITVTVTDSGGATSSTTFNVTVNPVNDPPVADGGGPYLGVEGLPVSMTGAGSSDIDDGIVAWDWDCDNDGTYETLGAAATGSSCSFDDDGNYTVGLRVTDASGTSATDTTGVTVLNAVPSITLTGPAGSAEGQSVTFTAAISDPSVADTATLAVAWTVMDPNGIVATGTGTSLTFLVPDDGPYTISASVTDDDGGSSVDALGFLGSNVAPTVGIAGPASGDEGTPLSWTLNPADASPVDAASLTTLWEITDAVGAVVANGSSLSVGWTPADDGAYVLALQPTDPPGATGTASGTIAIGNVAPVAATPSGPASGDEGSILSWTLAGADAGAVDAGNLDFAWTITDGTGGMVSSGTGTSPSWTPDDDGSYSLIATVTDPQGATGTSTLSLAIANVDPSVNSIAGPTTGDEGSSYSFDATVSDAGTADVLTTTWDWGDGSPTDTGTTAVPHTWADDGTFTVTVTVTDDDGGSDSATYTVVIGNVAPTIDTTPGTAAPEGLVYTYSPTVTDPGDEVFSWSLSASAPSGMALDPATGALSWTPYYADALVGSFPVTLTVNDGDGATDAQSWTIQVTVADDDGDGLADSWELANGLDPTDPNDATGDPDSDGMTNLDEYTNGTNPNSYDGPDAPVLTEPIAGDETSDDAPDLFWSNATDPQGDTLTYTVEVAEDQAFNTIVASTSEVTEDASGISTWKVPQPLSENATYWWRARATDPWVDGPWSTEESFVINAISEAPDAPVLTLPIAGETAASTSPVLNWSEASDVDGDALTYDVEVFDSDGNLVTSTTGVTGDGISASWEVDVVLDEDQLYAWTARAVDEHGLDGDWAEDEDFFVSSENGAPTDSVFVRPQDGASIEETSPTLEVTVSIDPEGGEVTYEFELDTSPSFNSGAGYEISSSSQTLDLDAEQVDLEENILWFARVRTVDEAGISSNPDTISFFVRGQNEPPGVPELVEPLDGADVGANPLLVVTSPLDPEGDVVFIEVRVARDPEFTDLVVEVDSLLADLGENTEWQVPANLSST